MAKDQGKKVAKKTKAEKKREQFMYVMAFIVIGTMLFSGLYYYGNSGNGGQTTQPTQEVPYFDSFQANPIPLNSSLIVTVGVVRPEVIAMAKASCINFQQVQWIYNLTDSGLKGVVLTAVNPQKSQYYDLCGSFIYFKFTYDNPPADLSGLDAKLRNTLGDYVLRRTYTGLLPMNLSGPGTDKVYVIGSPDIKTGDKSIILLFQKATDNSPFALEAKKLVQGPVIEGTVQSIDALLVHGSIVSDFDLRNISTIANMSDASVSPPKVVVNSSLNGSLLDELKSIPAVSVEAQENSTALSYNKSFADIRQILDAANLTYSLVNGSVSLKLPANYSIPKAKQVLAAAGISGAEFRKDGFLKVPSDVLIDGTVATVDGSDKFNAALNTSTNVGDTVNITLTALQFGDQVYIVGGQQT